MKIRGNTVGTTLKPERAVVAATNLTPEQQKQARDNIGASALIVTVTDGVASHTAPQICEHIQNGGVAYISQNGWYMPICFAYPNYAQAYDVADDWLIGHYDIGEDGEVVEQTIDFARSDRVTDIENQLGDIDTALDSIIAIQNSLIGGDA